MKIGIANIALNLTAWSDTAMGIELRIWMVEPILWFGDAVLAAYIVENIHF